jgi:hypothetical protein
VETTGSPRGKWILENWEQMLPKFVKVFPQEYKRVLRLASPAPAAELNGVSGAGHVRHVPAETQEVREAAHG